MKMIRQAISFFILFSVQVFFAQNIFKGEVSYIIKMGSENIELYKKSESRKKMDKRKRNYLDKMYFNSTIEEGVLLFKNDESLFQVTDKMRNDSYKGLNMVKNEAGGKKIFYYNSVVKKNIEQDCEMLGKCFLIETPLYEWEITQETKTIGNYLCYKAIITKEYKGRKSYTIAWFTPQIPVNFGPRNYNGLPGLILELEKNSIIYTAKKIELNSNRIIEIERPKGKGITQKEFRTLYQKSMNVKF
tara:strand:- start:3349 stop:4083 length:735 start_codon:yes stop_codon:yes gene_type:complete